METNFASPKLDS